MDRIGKESSGDERFKRASKDCSLNHLLNIIFWNDCVCLPANSLVKVPNSLAIAVILQVMPAFSMSFAIKPRPFVPRSIWPQKDSPAMLIIEIVFSLIGPSIWPFVDTFAVNHILLPLAFVTSSVLPNKLPLALHHVLYPRSNVITMVFPLEFALAVLFAVSELTFVYISVGPFIDTCSELHSIQPFSCVFGSVCMKVDSLSMLLVIGKLSLVKIAIRIEKFPISFCLALNPPPFISCSICPFLNPITVLHIILQLSLILSISFQLYLLYLVILYSLTCLLLELFFLTQILPNQPLHFHSFIVLILFLMRKYFPSNRFKPSRRTHFPHFTILIPHNNIHYNLFPQNIQKMPHVTPKSKCYYSQINIDFPSIMLTLSQKQNQASLQNDSEKLPFSMLTQIYDIVGQTKGENSKNIQKNHLSNMFKQLIRKSTDDLVRGYWLSIIKCGPEYEKNELFIGKEILVKSVARSCGMSEKQVRDQVNKVGDLGEVAQNSKSSQKTMDSFFTKKKAKVALTIEKVFSSFIKISKTKGNNSQSQKENILINLLLESSNQETKFIIRWIEGNLKISAGQKTMQKALVVALFEELFPKKAQTEQNFEEYELAIKKASAEYPNQEKIIRTLVEIKENHHLLSNSCKLTLGIPCKPMLAKPTRGIGDILSRFQGKRLTCEYKYDGLRGQVHYYEGNIQIFSRNLENITQAYVDLVENIRKNMAGKEKELSSFIIDCEIVAVSKSTKQLLPFQILATRSRKATTINEIQVHVNLFAFDILYFNEPITHLSLRERRQYLANLQPILSSDILRISEHSQVEDFEKIDEFLGSAIKFGTEGLMIKDLDSPYTCSRRSWQWVKLKKDYIDGLGDTLDLVPIGALFGAGKRKGLYGSYLLAAYNSDMEVYETICKIGTGFSDDVLQKAHEFFQDKISPFMPKEYRISSNGQVPDVWFTPSAVWEVKGADFQLSPIYTCGIGDADANRGIGLRFPRLIKVREDKKPHEASTNQFVIDLYRQQSVVKNNGKIEEQDDFY